MFKSISRLTVLAGLILTAACGGSQTVPTHDGSLDIVVDASRPGRSGEPVSSNLTITALDGTFRTSVALPRDSEHGALRVRLPAGLYAIEGAAGSDVDGVEPVIPTLSSPELVVVSPERVSSVIVHSVDAAEPCELAVLDAGFADR
jgi:hypothetical protein